MFTKILIANRGEIACRIIRSAKRLGIHTAVIYAKAEEQALHVQLADEAIEIPALTPRASYLDIPAIIKAAKQIDAQAIHPGYGFLSENSEFAQACQQAHMTFIGPSPQVLTLMGEKDQAKQLAQKIGVPIIPGYMGDEQNTDAFLIAAEKIGFPLLIKAIAGGGGKAQHIAHSLQELLTLIPTAMREAQQSFANPRLMLEKYLPNARHVEVQIFGDQLGHYVHLFDRDCSVQRRYQKVLEEACAPQLTENVRQVLWQDALKIAEHIQYVGAGTVEFLVAGNDHYFLEMNTRLQVEHPITECITNTDLVEWQLRVAADESLPLTQSELVPHGHAIEVRICAEDPEHDFLPATGKIQKIKFPTGVRVESGIQELSAITPYFDSLLAKLIVQGKTRAEAFYNLQQALAQTVIIGVTTNLGLLQRIVNQQNVHAYLFNTMWLESHPEIIKPTIPPQWLVYAAVFQMSWLLNNEDRTPWSVQDGWRMNMPCTYYFYFIWEGQSYNVTLLSDKQSPVSIKIQKELEQQDIDLAVVDLIHLPHGEDQEYIIHINHQEHRFRCYKVEQQLQLITLIDRTLVHIPTIDSSHFMLAGSHDPGLQAPMPGTVVQVFVTEQQTVAAGDRLLTLEAMKMEHTVRAPSAGVIQKLYYTAGDVVDAGAVLVEMV